MEINLFTFVDKAMRLAWWKLEDVEVGKENKRLTFISICLGIEGR